MRYKSKYNRNSQVNLFKLKFKKFFFVKKKKFRHHLSAQNQKLSPHKNCFIKKPIFNLTRTYNFLKGSYYITPTNLYHDNINNKYILEVALYNNIRFLIPYISGLQLGKLYQIRSLFPYNKYEVNFFSSLKKGALVSNLNLKKGALIGCAVGSYVVFLGKNMFLMPSGEVKLLKNWSNFFLGKNLTIFQKQKMKNKLSVVRGIAKNPVDHPNGGRANTKGSFKTPWGKIAKKGK